MPEPLALNQSRRIFGAPGPQDTGGAVYSTVKATADAGALQAQATAQAVGNVLGMLQGALEIKARRQEQLTEIAANQVLETRRQMGRMDLEAFEQGQLNARTESRNTAQAERQAKTLMLDRRKFAFDKRKAAAEFQLDQKTERRLNANELREQEMFGLKKEAARINVEIGLQDLIEGKLEHEGYELQKRTLGLFHKYQAHQNVQEGIDGRITGDDPANREALIGQYLQQAEDPAMFMEMAQQQQKLEQGAAKPEIEAQERAYERRAAAIKEGTVTDPETGQKTPPTQEWIEDRLQLGEQPKEDSGLRRPAAPQANGQATPAAQTRPKIADLVRKYQTRDLSDDEWRSMSEEEAAAFFEELNRVKSNRALAEQSRQWP
mgnify:CR=1 FL=1